MNPWIEHEKIVKETIFEFISLYGSPSSWDAEINQIFKETVDRKIIGVGSKL